VTHAAWPYCAPSRATVVRGHIYSSEDTYTQQDEDTCSKRTRAVFYFLNLARQITRHSIAARHPLVHLALPFWFCHDRRSGRSRRRERCGSRRRGRRLSSTSRSLGCHACLALHFGEPAVAARGARGGTRVELERAAKLVVLKY
jgi:hypothetical protein